MQVLCLRISSVFIYNSFNDKACIILELLHCFILQPLQQLNRCPYGVRSAGWDDIACLEDHSAKEFLGSACCVCSFAAT